MDTQHALDVIDHVRTLNGTKKKIEYLSENQDDIIRMIFAMAYDKVNFTWNCTLKQVMAADGVKVEVDLLSSLAWMLHSLGQTVKGKNACKALKSFIISLPKREGNIIKDILDRNMRVGLNVKSINKALNGIVPVVEYMRCDVFKQNHKIPFPALLQVKMDGTWREIRVGEGKVQIFTRQGHRCENPVLEGIFKEAPDGRYIGELTIPGLSRVQSNGNINSDNPSYSEIHFTAWDFVTNQNVPYSERFNALKNALPKSDLVGVVETVEVNSNKEAMAQVKAWVEKGEEGGVLKSKKGKFKNGTSQEQLKIKPVIEVDVRVTGFTDGSERTSREGKIGAIMFATDDGKISGQTSGFSQALLDEMSKNRDAYIGKVMSVQCNNLQLAEGSSVYRLMNPRFIEFRELVKTDTIERVKEMSSLSLLF